MNFRGRRNRRHFIHNACIQNSEQQEEQGTDTCHFDESVNFDRAAAILSGPIVDPDRLIPGIQNNLLAYNQCLPRADRVSRSALFFVKNLLFS